MKKRILASTLACGILAAASGCSGGGGNVPLRVDAFFYDYADTYINTVRSELRSRLEGSDGAFSYDFYDGASNQATQTQQVETALIRGSRLLIVNIVTTGSDEAAQVILQSAAEREVPVIFFNREVSDEIVASNENCCFVGTDADEAGYKQGEMVADFFSDPETVARYDRSGDGKLSYVMFRGELGNAEAFGRTKYSVLRANELTGGLLIPSAANAYDATQEDDGASRYYLYGNWSADKAKNLMDTALITYSLDAGDIELVLANNDEQALGAVESLQEHGYNRGDPDRTVPVFGVDATEAARSAIDEGAMTGTVRQDAAAMAACIAALAENVRAGRPLTANTDGYEKDEGIAKIRIPYGVYTAAAEPVSDGNGAGGGDVPDGRARSGVFPEEDALSGGPDVLPPEEDVLPGGADPDGGALSGDGLPDTGVLPLWRAGLPRSDGETEEPADGPAKLPDVRPELLPLPDIFASPPDELPNALLPDSLRGRQQEWAQAAPGELWGVCGAGPQERRLP